MGYLDTYWDNPTLWSIEISVLDLDNPVFFWENPTELGHIHQAMRKQFT